MKIPLMLPGITNLSNRCAAFFCASMLYVFTMSNVFALDFEVLRPILSSPSKAKALKQLRLNLEDVGRLKAPSRQLTVIDPGWMFPDRISHLVKKAPGEVAEVKLAMITGGENEGMPAFILLGYGNLSDIVGFELAELSRLPLGGPKGRVSVDSGEISVIETARIPKGDQAVVLAFGEHILKHSKADRAAVIDPKDASFIVVKSGNGDGAYPCYWLTDTKSKIIALLIDFENWTPAQNR